MANNELLLSTPLEGINCSFADYVAKKKQMLSSHMSGNGLPDYAYCMDYEYRKKLDAVPGLYKNLKRLTVTAVEREYQLNNMKGLLVTPNQFGEIYQMGVDCAMKLGIGIPNIFVLDDGSMNAWTMACDDQEPIIVVTSLLLQRMTLGEIKCVIGHECGHIHNNHTVYDALARIVANKMSNQIVSRGFFLGLAEQTIEDILRYFSTGALALLNMWSRAAETTCDRAAMICCDSIEDAYSVNKKFVYGGTNISSKINTDINIDELRKQLETVNESSYRLFEALDYDHPMSIRRIFAQMEFAKCETLYSWRPDLKKPGEHMQSRTAIDDACKKIIGVMQTKEGRK